MFPWYSMDQSVVLTSPYSYPYPIPVRPSPIPMHPKLHPFLSFSNQNPIIAPTTTSTYMPYSIPPLQIHIRNKFRFTVALVRKIQVKGPLKERKSAEYENGNRVGESDVSNDVAIELELKIPGSSTQQEQISESKKGKRLRSQGDSVDVTIGSSLFRDLQDNLSRSVNNSPRLSK